MTRLRAASDARRGQWLIAERLIAERLIGATDRGLIAERLIAERLIAKWRLIAWILRCDQPALAAVGPSHLPAKL